LNQASGYRVLTGNVDASAPETEAQVSAVSRVITCPCFDRDTKVGDVALLELSRPTSAPAVTLAPLPHGVTEAIVAGWGDTYDKQSAAVEQLRWAQTVVQRPVWCEREASPFSPASETCAIDEPDRQTGPCSGDSGGPLLIREPAAIGGMVQIGITSHVYEGCATTSPSVFTRADAISAWTTGWAQALTPGAPASPSSAAVLGPTLPGIANGRSVALRNGIVSLVLDCDSHGGTCTGAVQASITVREQLTLEQNGVRTISTQIRRAILASASFAIASGASVVIGSKLSSQNRALLSHLRGRRLDVSLTGSGVARRVLAVGAVRRAIPREFDNAR